MLDAEAISYVEYHAERYARLLSVVETLAGAVRVRDRLRVLDVGPNIQTELLRSAHPNAVIDTLGFAHPAFPPREHERHVELDLNGVTFPDRQPLPPAAYDIVIVAEVVEHLHIPLAAVLSALAGCLRTPGHIVVQTPNGAALHKRIRLLLGRSPVEPPRACAQNPGHFHEYTLAELRDQVRSAGLVIDCLEVANHFGGGAAASRAYRAAGRFLSPALRHGVTLCAHPAP
ncbi:MAG TPA: methyltransferase domain-containing protein [Solirubrobacteraceae bacterium]